MPSMITLKKSNCKNCYKCIRNCPVKSIRFSGSQAHIIEQECVLCGRCFVVCPQNAKQIAPGLEKARVLVSTALRTVATLAPSFIANYPGVSFSAMRRALKKLGFFDVMETAQGATMVKDRYAALVGENKHRLMITSCCHTVNLLIEKHFPQALPYLMDVVSPMYALGQEIKRQDDQAKVVFIGPCISKKDEIERYPGAVDCVLTFDELSAWLEEENIALAQEEETLKNSLARLFPVPGGILRTMRLNPDDLPLMVVDGMDNCVNALKDVCEGKLTEGFIEMSACQGSCVGGPVIEKREHSPLSAVLRVKRAAGNEDFVTPAQTPDALVRHHVYQGMERQMPGERQIREILLKMGKHRPEDELNCGSCGYDTCREKAVAVFLGKADLNMCLPFLKDRAESFSDNIISNTPNGILVLNEQLEVQQINSAACRMLNLRAASDVLGEQVICILDPKPFMDVRQTGRGIRDRAVYLAEYKRYVEQTIVFDAAYKLLICILRDVTEDANARRRQQEINAHTVETADKVVEKQLRVVQEIASLLGETAAETKVALSKLKESITHE